MPCRSPYSPVRVVRTSSEVCAMSGVWLFESIVPLPSMKCSRFGIISRSESTFGLSRKKCTLSNVTWMTCWTPLPRWQAVPAVTWTASARVAADQPGAADAARAKPAQERRAPGDDDGPPGDPSPALVLWHEPLLSSRPSSTGRADPAGDPRAALLTPGDGGKTARPTLRVPWRTGSPTPGARHHNLCSHLGSRLGPHLGRLVRLPNGFSGVHHRPIGHLALW